MYLNKIRNKTKGSIDLNSLLKFLDFLIFIFLWISYSINGPNEYINLNSIILGSILALEIYLFLLVEKSRRDPFILLLCFQLVFYFLLRILTLSIYPFSVAFERFAFTSSDLNYSIIYIIASNMALFLGFYLNKFKKIDLELAQIFEPKNPYFIFIIFLFGFLMAFPDSIGLGAIQKVIGFFASLFVDLFIIMLMIIIYLILYRHKIHKIYRFFLIFCLIGFVAVQTLVGSRSAILIITYFLIFAFLSIYGAIKIKLKVIAICTFFIPILIFIFTLATFLRPRLEKKSQINYETLSVLNEFDLKEITPSNAEVLLIPIFDRIGYLDYAAELIAHDKIYSPIFSYEYYAKSFIDNILTPGFDIFGIPKVSNSQRFIYNNEGQPTKARVDEAYQSDEFTFYGESYVLYGKWFSLIPIFFIAFLFKRIYVKINDKNIFHLSIKRSIILMIFYYLMNSYGLDWVAALTIGFISTYFLFRWAFQFRIIENLN